MKHLFTIIYLGLVCITFSCSKKNDPTPTPVQTLSISSFSPQSGAVGNTVVILGSAFGSDPDAISVKFGTSTGIKPTVVNVTSMTVIVPADAQTGKIQVTIGTNTVTSASDFVLTKVSPPTATITGFSPTTAQIGDIVTITGTAFGTDTNFVSVKFGTSKAIKPASVTATSMTVIVPNDAQTGKIQIAVNGGTPVFSSTDFTLKPQPFTITSIAPTTVTQGDTLVINGTQFGSDINGVLVYLNRGASDLGTKPISVTATQIKVVVPSNSVSGNVKVFVQGLGSITSTQTFTFIPLLFLGGQITPGSARAGEIVQINGDFPSTTSLNSVTVQFAGSTVLENPLAVDGHDNISVRVPLDAKTGYVKVTKTGFATNKVFTPFTVLPPMPPVQSGTWTQRPDFLYRGTVGGGRAGAFAFTIDNKAYVGTGTTNAPFDGYAQSDLWQYDPAYNAWMQVADFGGGIRIGAVAFSIGSKGYAGLGTNPNIMSDFWEYDPTANTWAQKADFGGGAREAATGFAVGNYGYIGTGSSGNNFDNDFYQYNPASNVWSQITSIPGVRIQAYSFVVGNQAYVGGGNVGNSSPKLDLYMYDPATNGWTAKTAIPNFAYTSLNASFTIGNKGYVGLGVGYINGVTTNTDQVFEYTASTDSWKSLPNFAGGARNSAVGFSIGNIGYFGMGQTVYYASPYKDFWAYTP